MFHKIATSGNRDLVVSTRIHKILEVTFPLPETFQPDRANSVLVSIRQEWHQHQGKRALHHRRTGDPKVLFNPSLY